MIFESAVKGFNKLFFIIKSCKHTPRQRDDSSDLPHTHDSFINE